MSIDMEAIRKRAEAATPGPWTNHDAKRGRSKAVYLAATDHEKEDLRGGPSRYGPHRDYIANALGPPAKQALANAEFIAHAREDVPALIAEIERLHEWVNDLQSGMYINCVYCGHRYGPDTEVPASMADVLKAHVEQCLKHPMSKLRDLARLQHEALEKILAEFTAEHMDSVSGTNCWYQQLGEQVQRLLTSYPQGEDSD